MSESLPAGGTEIVRSEFAYDAEFAELLEAFAVTLAESQEKLRALHRTGDWEQLRVRAHQLKGAGGGYGFPGVSCLAAELEQACDSREDARISRTLDALIDYLVRIEI